MNVPWFIRFCIAVTIAFSLALLFGCGGGDPEDFKETPRVECGNGECK